MPRTADRKLYQFPHSHFSEKARWALDWKGLAYEKVNLTRGRHERTTRKLGSATTVPILVDRGRAIQDSTAILDYLEDTYPSPPLDPPGDAGRAEARRLEELFDDAIGFHSRRFAYAALIERPDVLKFMFLQGKGALPRLAFPILFAFMKPKMVKSLGLGPGAADESETEMMRALDAIDARLAEGDYLVADRFTRADLTAAALLSLLTWPPEHDFKFPPPEMLPERLRAFLDAIRGRPVFEWSLRMYARHRRKAPAA